MITLLRRVLSLLITTTPLLLLLLRLLSRCKGCPLKSHHIKLCIVNMRIIVQSQHQTNSKW
jgi:hypothetical protein